MEEKKKNFKGDLLNMGFKLTQKAEQGKRTVADYLAQQSEKLSPSKRKFTFLFLGVAMAGICLSFLVNPFQQTGPKNYFLPSQASTPTMPVPIHEADSAFSAQDYQTLVAFKHTLDSLKQTNPAGYEDLMKGREGLLDSINFLISIYQ